MPDCAVLFADVSGSTSLYEILGDERAFALIECCLNSMSTITTDGKGRVIKTIGDAVMSVFPSADDAAAAATEMQIRVANVGKEAKAKLGLRIGFQYGPVMEQGEDVFGDTVNLAARLCDLASKGQIVTSRETVSHLSRMFMPSVRHLYSIPVKGKENEVDLLELIWQGSAEELTTISASAASSASGAVLRLKLREHQFELGRERRKVTFGRDLEMDFPIHDRMASRAHCMIERRRDRFVLIDHSSNGTFLTIESDRELILRREEFPLRGHGWIAFGQSKRTASEVVEFTCEE